MNTNSASDFAENGLSCKPSPIRFYHRGKVLELPAGDACRSVLDWLREEARCTGTKEGCNEGDCGACTVVIGELSPSAMNGLALRNVNACLQFLPTLDGKALFTVEDLRGLQVGRLHPVQQALVDFHGSQCGFCTPGFVMSLWAVYERHRALGTRPTRQQLAHELSGNLCRCTGYRPILDAAEAMFELPGSSFDAAAVAAQLHGVQRSGTANLAAPGQHFHVPRSVFELAELCQRFPGARLLAGGTDIALWVTKQFKPLPELIYLGQVAELRCIQALPDGSLLIGAAALLEDAWGSLAQRHPETIEMGLRFASPPIRQAGTLGGNLANGSPIGDAAPLLMALDAQLLLRQADVLREVPLCDFYVAYQRSQLQTGEFIQAIRVPAAPAGLRLAAYKLSKRFDSDISAVSAGLSLVLEEGRVAQVRLAFGGMAATVRRAAAAEAALRGQPWTQAALQAAQQALVHDFTPMDDLRASAAYRLRIAQNLLQRFWLEQRTEHPLPQHALRIRPLSELDPPASLQGSGGT